MFVACGIVATALACGDNKSSNPAAPSAPGGVTEGATTDGTTLKITAPTPVAPANGSTLEDNSVPLRISASTAKFASSSGPLAYRFQILLNGQVVKEARVVALEWALPDLESNTTYSWRSRGEQGPYFGPWSAEWTFKTAEQPDGYIRGGELYDPLVDGRTVGIPRGSVTFVPGVGAKINNWSAYIEYHLQQTVTSGELSMLITNLATNTEGGKTKVMAMSEGGADITTNDRRFTAEKRGRNPAGAIAWRMITSNDQIDTTGGERVQRDFNPSKTYFWKATWGGGRFNLLIREGGVNGKQIYSFGKGYGGSYDPSPHYAYVGGPAGRAGRDSGSVNDMIVRQVWLSSRPRPSYANK
jgi:hypothetical protein